MKYTQLDIQEQAATVQLSAFSSACGIHEWHAIIHVKPLEDTFSEQYSRLCLTEEALMKIPELKGARPVLRRYFLSDSTNQRPLFSDETSRICTTSYIQQPPLDGSKVALWLYLQEGSDVVYNADSEGSTIVEHNGYRHTWTMGMVETQGDSYKQTWELFNRYDRLLSAQGATVTDNCLRTWLFVRDVDTNYHGLVVARREYFDKIGLTKDTHYISSTGIGGSPAETKALVQLGSYALTGFLPEQQKYLYAPSHLNHTSDYGVTFERGTLMLYGDRRHVYISGTASIDNHGEVMHVGDIRRQTLRMWENVEKLLSEADMTMEHCAHIIVYLRDTADYSIVQKMFAERFPSIPTVITLAPVCRPTWLIEMECMAIREDDNPEYRAF